VAEVDIDHPTAVITPEVDVDALDASHIEAETQPMVAKAVAAGLDADVVMGMMTSRPIQVVIILIYPHQNGTP
jgi:hypothetical protein